MAVRLRERLAGILAAAGLSPNHRLGQNFMIDSRSLSALVDGAALTPGSRVVEIGPGTGFLTERLLAAEAVVLAIELDRGLFHYLSQHFAEAIASGQLTLEQGDALASKATLHPAVGAFAAAGPWSLVSNLPYDISIPAILNALTCEQPAQSCAVTVQYEAAQRLVSQPGSKAWGATAAVAQAAGSGRIAAKFPGQCFYPPPRVDSALLCWRRERQVPEGFATWCRQCFAYRRKVLSRALRDLGIEREQAQAVVEAGGLSPTCRVEQLTVEQLLGLFARLYPTAA